MKHLSRSLSGTLQDLGLGVRLLAREPAFATVAVLTLALGIGANTAMFGVIDAVLLKPFPYRDADGILFVGQRYGQEQGIGSIPPGNFPDWKQNQAFAALARARGTDMSLAGTGEPTQVHAGLVSADVFPLLGIDPLLGRVFGPGDDREGADRVAVLGYGLWQSRFGGDPRVLGQTVRLDDQSYTLVGVMPRGFKLWAADLWVPIGLGFDGEFKGSRVVNNGLFGLGRLRPGATLEEAKAEMAVIAARLAQDYPEANQGVRAGIVRLKDSVTSGIRPALLVLLAAVGFVLLIACANVANLLLARAAGREKELAIRTVLGARRGRLVRQMLLEGLPLAALGGLAGVGLAQLALRGLLVVIPPDAIPAEADIHLDARVLVFTLAACLLTTLLFGLLPALQASRAEVGKGLREGARGSSGGRGLRLRSALIIGEVALSLALLVGAGLLMRSFWQLRSVDPGFRSHDVLKMEINLPPRKYGETTRSQAFFEQALERIGGLPGVLHAGLGPLPFGANTTGMPLVEEGKTYQSLQDLPNVQLGLVMGDYFEALGIAVREGRGLSPEDREGAPPVAVVNRSLVRRFFPDGKALGKRVQLGLPDNLIRPGLLPPGLESFPWVTVVGVVDDVKQNSLAEESSPLAYIPYVQSLGVPALRNSSAILVQASGDPLSIAAPVRAQIGSLDRDQAIVRLGRLDDLVAESLRQPRFGTLLLALFAGLALVLASVGIYGLVSYAVSQRTRELGIRMALGAGKQDVLALILRQGMTLVGAGLLVGLAIAFGLSRFLKSLLFEVEAADPLTFALVPLVLALVALFACYVPARRAVRTDPLAALRYE